MPSLALIFHSMAVLIKENTVMLGEASLDYTIVTTVGVDDLGLLSTEEQHLWYSEKQYRRNGNDWLSGRVAGKACIRRWAKGMHDLQFDANEISIINHSSGFPLIHWPILTIEPRASVSLSHKDGIGFSVVTGERGYIGCDIERNTSRSIRCIPYFSTQSEYVNWESWCTGFCDSVSLLWTCKEAAIKCLRPAVQGELSLENVIVSPLNSGTYRVEYNRFIGSGMWWTDHKYIFAICRVTELDE